ncbi:MAG: pyridoxamine 5'-phosphate oxidase family protein, partial [Ignavibacteria bacterium]|nr:pyridoxamine 5'-phosphate oxidase family protein [Ignavibacteria bacterium]
MDDKEIQNLRRQYSKSTLSASSVSKDPFKQFEKWFQEVLNSGFLEPNAMTLATSSKNGRPTARVVLLKGVHDGGFVFYT